MASTTVETSAASTPAPEPSLGLLQRTAAIFARPTQAWSGLRERVQWWFPMLVVMVFGGLLAAILHRRAILPMVTAQWRDQVANGQISAEQVQRMESFFGSPTGLAISVAQQMLALAIITLLIALVVWFGIGFILGRPLSYRLSLEVAAWSGLIAIPTHILTGILAWTRETMRGVHAGFGILLPDSETPNRFMIGLGIFLDALGPLSIWYVVVLVLGAAALSGAPRKQVAWVLGGLYLVLFLFFASLAALFAPTS